MIIGQRHVSLRHSPQSLSNKQLSHLLGVTPSSSNRHLHKTGLSGGLQLFSMSTLHNTSNEDIVNEVAMASCSHPRRTRLDRITRLLTASLNS